MDNNSDDISRRLKKTLASRETPALPADIVTSAADRPAPRIVHNGRRALTGGALTLAVAAATVGALVLTAPTQQGPLFTAAAVNAPGAASDTALAAPEGDQRMMIWANYEYVAGPELSSATGSGHVYKLERTGTPDSVLTAVAAQFGVKGDSYKSEYYDPTYPSYVIGAEDGSAPSVLVTWAGTGDWWYNDSSAYPTSYGCDVPRADDDSTSSTTIDVQELPVCDTSTPTENLAPSEADARAQAQKIFAATGLNVDASDITVTADDWQTVATATLTVNGTKTALEWTVGWSSTGKISFAYGHSVAVVDKGSYGTVSERDAVGRIASGRWYGAAGPDYQSGVMLFAEDTLRGTTSPVSGQEDAQQGASETPTEEPTEGTAPDEGSVPDEGTAPSEGTDPGEGTDPTAEPVDPTATPEPTDEQTPEPLPTPKTIVVIVSEAHETLLEMWDSNGDAWLVPGYAMPTQEGWFNTVVSLVDGVIALPDPIDPSEGEINEP
jgi:hypothetical protein